MQCMHGGCTETTAVEVFWTSNGEHFGYFCDTHRPEFTRRGPVCTTCGSLKPGVNLGTHHVLDHPDEDSLTPPMGEA